MERTRSSVPLVLFAVVLAIIAALLAFPPLARSDVAITWSHGVPDPSLTNTIQRSPATVTRHSGGTGPFVLGLHTPLEWAPRQQCFVNGVEWVLEWHGAWYFTHPDHAGSPFRLWGEWIPVPNAAWHYRYNVEPRGFRMQAPTIYASRLGWSQDIWWRHRHAGTLGGETTSRVYGTTPNVYGTCGVSEQDLGWPGSLYGFVGSIPEFFAWSWDRWETGIIVMGPDPYQAASNTIGDFDRSGAVTVSDIFDFLACYCGGEPAADLNHSGAVTEADLFTFLTCWFSAS